MLCRVPTGRYPAQTEGEIGAGPGRAVRGPRPVGGAAADAPAGTGAARATLQG
ncbi:hypothetical protein SROCM77S_05300 [Streptomyces rochei]